MTSKIYRTAQGKSVDLGTIMLKNENTRAVGNMKVNARGDKIDGMNRVIETKTEQIQKQNNKTTTNVSTNTVHASSGRARAARQQAVAPQSAQVPDPIAPVQAVAPQVPDPVVEQPATPVADPAAEVVATPKTVEQPTQGQGLAGAIARTRQIKQELDRTRRQQAQDTGVKKI